MVYSSILQPDVVAPGYFTYSARASGSSDSTCDILSMAGTSMATPAAAGAAATIRQYFQDTSFWAQMCNKTYSKCGTFTPKGATIKAMLIGSGHPMTDYKPNGYDTKEPAAVLATPPDYYQGYGRISLQNVLPYTGIEEVIDLFVDELVIESLTKVTYIVHVSDVSRPLKATIVWMDPTNADVTAKMLLHDLDLIVIDPSGNYHYGNGVAKDEVNNVEQVAIDNPVVGTYTVEILGKTFWESPSQAVSVVITSGGSVGSPTTSVVSENEAYYQMTCNSNEVMLSLRKMDSEGDGWGSLTYTVFDNSGGGTVLSGTMSSAIPNDILSMDHVCVTKEVKYTVEMSNLNAGGWGLEIDQCGVYMSDSSSGNQEFTFNSVGECNVCSDYSLSLLLVGSLYGIPYGWKDHSMYSLESDSDDVTLSVAGTLATGMTDEHNYCVPEGFYKLRFNSIPESDDALDDDYLANYFGVEEYGIVVDNAVMVKPTQYALITVGASGIFVELFDDSSTDDGTGPNDDDTGFADDDYFVHGEGSGSTTLSTGEIAGIAVAAVVGVIGLNVGAEYLAAMSPSGDDDSIYKLSNVANKKMD